MKLILLGAPGAGKGSHAKLISKKYNIPQISMGDIIRENIKQGSELGLKFKSYADKGNLVPDELVIELLKDRLKKDDCENGYILDGFPRTLAQAEALENIAEIDKVLLLDCTEETVVQRLSGRRTCKRCGKIFHMTNMPPKVEGICDACKGELFQRDDDNEETIKNRLNVFREQTSPLIEFYKNKNILKTVDANPQLEEAYPNVEKALEE